MRTLLLLLPLFWAEAQSQPQEAIDAAIREYRANAFGMQFQKSVDARQRARLLLAQLSVTAPRFADLAQDVASLYHEGSLDTQAQAILQESLARASALGKESPTRIALLNSLADWHESEGSFLKAADYWEASAAAQPPTPSADVSLTEWAVNGFRRRLGLMQVYKRLARLYQRMGRFDSRATVAARARAMGAIDPLGLADFDEQEGQFEDAEEIYRNLALQAPDPSMRSSYWQSVARLAYKQHDYAGAAAATEQAIADEGGSSRVLALLQSLISDLHAAGLDTQEEGAVQRLLQNSADERGQIRDATWYAQYLVQTGRAAQAVDFLRAFSANHPSSGQEAQDSIAAALVSAAQQAGDSATTAQFTRPRTLYTPPPPTLLDKAFRAENSSEAYRYGLAALEEASPSNPPGEWVGELASRLEPAHADQLFARLFSRTQSWEPFTMEPALMAAKSWVQYLSRHGDREAQLAEAYEQYQTLLMEAFGPDSTGAADSWRLHLMTTMPGCEEATRKLIAFQESLSGNTSDSYLNDLDRAVGILAAVKDYASALPLYRQSIALTDLRSEPGRQRLRSQARADAARAFEGAGQLDQAEILIEEAFAILPPGDNYSAYLQTMLGRVRLEKQANLQPRPL
jgi:tetratricopeptide (TPR) repeat protein